MAFTFAIPLSHVAFPSSEKCRLCRLRLLSTRQSFSKYVLPPVSSATQPSGSPSQSETLNTGRLIPSTPCFTRHITASPMPSIDRNVYIKAAVDAALTYCRALAEPGNEQLNNVCNLTLLLPQLDPELDVFDRRFVLSLTWSLVIGLAFESGLKTRVLVQGVRKYGAIPLSVAGLRRTFEADMAASADAWGGEEAMSSVLRTGDLEDPNSVEDEDDAIVVITPCNATSTPVVNDVMELAERVGSRRPIILINPRLSDVPSAAGVMGVSGRAARNDFLKNSAFPFYLRLLFDSGTLYPLRAIVYRAYSGPWQLWIPAGSPGNETETYGIAGEFDERPTGSQLDDAMAAARRQRRLASGDIGEPVGMDTLLGKNLPAALALTAVIVGFVLLKTKDSFYGQF